MGGVSLCLFFLCASVRAAVTGPQTGGLNQQTSTVSQLWMGGGPVQGAGGVGSF